MTRIELEEHMAHALRLAACGRGYTSPNPMVGAVIVKNGRVIAEGFHQRYGGPHAEAAALEAATEPVDGATLFVTLEPCCHYGKTPPCTDAIIRAGIAKVVIAMEDPNPIVSCKGKRLLEESGIKVESGILGDAAVRLNEWYVKFITTGRPFFTAKAAMTLDGKIATRTGGSRWVTSEEARKYVHWLRAGVDAVMVGSGTVKADDPLLTTRLDAGNGRDATRIIIDGDAAVSPESRVFKLSANSRTVVVVKTTAADNRKSLLLKAGAELIEIEPVNGKIDLGQLAKVLGSRGIASVMIEGGGGLLAAAFDAGIVDKVLFFIAPKIFGGKDAPTPVEGFGIAEVADAIKIQDFTARMIGEDILIEGYVSL